MSVQNQRLRRMFDSDSAIMMETLSRMLLGASPGRFEPQDVDRAFRAAHSIKSEAGFLNLAAIAESAHRLEDVLSEARRSDGNVDDQLATALRTAVRALAEALEAYRAERTREAAGSTEDAISAPETKRAEADRASDGAASALALRTERGMLREARRRGEHLYRLSVAISSPPQMRYARAFLVVNNLELSCAVIRTDPPLDRVQESGSERLSFVITGPGDEQLVRSAVERAVHVDEVELLEFAESNMDDVFGGAADDGVDPAAGARRRAASGSLGESDHEEVRLFAEEIMAAADELAEDLVPEGGGDGDDPRLVRIRSYARFLRERMGGTAEVQLLDVLREIRDNAVRYAARHGKRVRVVFGGQGALVSATVADTLLETVMHLVRNSVDHGIRAIAERAKAGRHPSATIKVRVDRAGGGVRVVLQDDGDGVDEGDVRARAGDSASALLEVLARPGFSMRRVPDATSGRGVGLDTVVHSVRTLLGGQIRMINKPGVGLTFVITVPASARLIHVLLVESAGGPYAIPLATVVCKERLERRKVKRDSFGGLYYEHDGAALPLSSMTGRSPGARSLGDRSLAVVVRTGRDLRALVVDEVLAEEAVVREDARVGTVYARSLGRDVPFIFPASLSIG